MRGRLWTKEEIDILNSDLTNGEVAEIIGRTKNAVMCKRNEIREFRLNHEKIYITYEGETHSIGEWAEIKGLNRHALYTRWRRGENGAWLLREKNIYKSNNDNWNDELKIIQKEIKSEATSIGQAMEIIERHMKKKSK